MHRVFGLSLKIRIFSIGKATISLKADQTEHDELVRLREENKLLRKELAEKEADHMESARLINSLLAKEYSFASLTRLNNN